ncbi:MAG: DUF1080 domain-containing protein [Bryobacterales bacterium]
MWSRRHFLTTAACSAFAGSSLPAAEEGFQPLFNGNDLSGWQGDTLLWTVDNGELVGRTPGIGYNDFLATAAEYGDFVLRFEVRLVDDVGNSGVQFRSQRMKGSMEMIGYQADIGPGWWGDLYDESRRRVTLVEADTALTDRIVKKDGWNEYEIDAQGPKIKLTLNGKVTAQYEEEAPNIERSGRIAVQVHAGPPIEVRFRNMRIRTL